MKRTRHKRVPSVRRRALQIIAANPTAAAKWAKVIRAANIKPE